MSIVWDPPVGPDMDTDTLTSIMSRGFRQFGILLSVLTWTHTHTSHYCVWRIPTVWDPPVSPDMDAQHHVRRIPTVWDPPVNPDMDTHTH